MSVIGPHMASEQDGLWLPVLRLHHQAFAGQQSQKRERAWPAQ